MGYNSGYPGENGPAGRGDYERVNQTCIVCDSTWEMPSKDSAGYRQFICPRCKEKGHNSSNSSWSWR